MAVTFCCPRCKREFTSRGGLGQHRRHTAGRPCPDNRDYTEKYLASPWNTSPPKLYSIGAPTQFRVVRYKHLTPQ